MLEHAVHCRLPFGADPAIALENERKHPGHLCQCPGMLRGHIKDACTSNMNNPRYSMSNAYFL